LSKLNTAKPAWARNGANGPFSRVAAPERAHAEGREELALADRDDRARARARDEGARQAADGEELVRAE